MILFNTHFSTRPVLSMPMTITDDDQRGALLNDDRDADDDLVLTAYAKPCLLLGLSVAQRWSRIINIIIISIIKIIVIVRPGTTHSSQQNEPKINSEWDTEETLSVVSPDHPLLRPAPDKTTPLHSKSNYDYGSIYYFYLSCCCCCYLSWGASINWLYISICSCTGHDQGDQCSWFALP